MTKLFQIITGVLFLACLVMSAILLVATINGCIRKCEPRIECAVEAETAEIKGFSPDGLYDYKTTCIKQKFKLIGE